jgi:hypothetical protein
MHTDNIICFYVNLSVSLLHSIYFKICSKLYFYIQSAITLQSHLFAADDCRNAMQFGRQFSTFQRCQPNQIRWPHIPEENNLHCHFDNIWYCKPHKNVSTKFNF